MRKQKLVVNYIYHVYNRGVEKRRIFLDNKDFTRFANDLIVFNDKKLVINPKQRLEDIQSGRHKRTPLVDIIAFCLMPNHYHFGIETIELPISKIMHQINNKYVKYFRHRYGGFGHLFQERYFAKVIDKEKQGRVPFFI